MSVPDSAGVVGTRDLNDREMLTAVADCHRMVVCGQADLSAQ
jgi:hypothetical protein